MYTKTNWNFFFQFRCNILDILKKFWRWKLEEKYHVYTILILNNPPKKSEWKLKYLILDILVLVFSFSWMVKYVASETDNYAITSGTDEIQTEKSHGRFVFHCSKMFLKIRNILNIFLRQLKCASFNTNIMYID